MDMFLDDYIACVFLPPSKIYCIDSCFFRYHDIKYPEDAILKQFLRVISVKAACLSNVTPHSPKNNKNYSKSPK